VAREKRDSEGEEKYKTRESQLGARGLDMSLGETAGVLYGFVEYESDDLMKLMKWTGFFLARQPNGPPPSGQKHSVG
jgi:hypothetical protein